MTGVQLVGHEGQALWRPSGSIACIAHVCGLRQSRQQVFACISVGRTLLLFVPTACQMSCCVVLWLCLWHVVLLDAVPVLAYSASVRHAVTCSILSTQAWYCSQVSSLWGDGNAFYCRQVLRSVVLERSKTRCAVRCDSRTRTARLRRPVTNHHHQHTASVGHDWWMGAHLLA